VFVRTQKPSPPKILRTVWPLPSRSDWYSSLLTESLARRLRMMASSAFVAISRRTARAYETQGPIHLMRVFGLSAQTAVKFVRVEHPERWIIHPIQQ